MVRLYFMRQSSDFIVDIAHTNNVFTIEVKDTTPNDSFYATTTVATYRELSTYIEILFEQVFNDLDCPEPFLRFQYNINPFPTVLIPLPLLDNCRFKRFMNALHYYCHVQPVTTALPVTTA